MQDLTKAGQPGKKNWLASLLMRRGNALLPRVLAHFQHLTARPRAWRRRFRRRAAVTLAGAALLLALAGASLRAEGDGVITVVNGEVKVADNGKCSLSEAIKNANNQTTGRPFDDCAAGNPNGADTIVLPEGGVFTLKVPEGSGGDVLLSFILDSLVTAFRLP